VKKITCLVVSLALYGCGPRNYDDCILQNMKGVNDKTAAELIMLSCQEKFDDATPTQKCTMREMSNDERQLLQINARIGYKPNYITLTAYNGNTTVSLEELIVGITAKNYSAPQTYKAFLSYGVAPQSARDDIGISVAERPLPPWGFYILSAKTCTK